MLVVLGAAGTAVGQSSAPVEPDADAVFPKLALRGFADVTFSSTDRPGVRDGFGLGQFVLHLSAPLGNKVSFFAETTFTARTGDFAVEVERVSLKYDVNDRLKISAGRFHTPVNYWNTAFHHGLWLQTTISRPEMIRGGGVFQPVHLVGILAEGLVSSPTLGLGYNVGVGNGRDSTISRGGDAGDVNPNRALIAKVYARPASLYGVEFGGSAYRDMITTGAASRLNERILSAYLALTRETPEIIAEFADVHHTDDATRLEYGSRAFYAQAAYRAEAHPRWKPYYRFETLVADAGDPVFRDIGVTISTAGIRFELTGYSALKVEYRHERHDPDDVRSHGVFMQAAWTF